MAMVISYLAIPPIVRVSKAKDLGARPNGRTSHQGIIPELGGVAIFAATMIGGFTFFHDNFAPDLRFIVPASMVIFFVGMKDDIIGLPAKKKLVGQILASLFVIIPADIRILDLSGIFGIHLIGYVPSILITLVIFVGLINAYNLIDGIDGLASGLGIFGALSLGMWLLLFGRENYATLAFALAGGLIPFYFFNVFSSKNKIFMGDTGSQFLGLLFAIFSVKVLHLNAENTGITHVHGLPALMMGVMAIPIADTLRVMTLRILKGRSPFSPDRTHFHHALLDLGLMHIQASSLILLCNASLFVIAWSMHEMPTYLLFFLILGLALLCTVMPSWILRMNRAGKVKRDALPEDEALGSDNQRLL
jgi:UDP-GlcNAc:undecaprenyl-phosphate GlcNAc-1-phosphate transferase